MHKTQWQAVWLPLPRPVNLRHFECLCIFTGAYVCMQVCCRTYSLTRSKWSERIKMIHFAHMSSHFSRTLHVKKIHGCVVFSHLFFVFSWRNNHTFDWNVKPCTLTPWLMGRFNTNKCVGDDTKGVARRSPNCIRKTKNTFYGTAGICPITEILWKIASSHKNSQKSVLSYAKKLFLNGGRPPSWIKFFLLFDNRIVTEFQVCVCVQNFMKIRWIFIASQHTDARYWYIKSVCPFVCLSVRPSVTLRYCMKTA